MNRSMPEVIEAVAAGVCRHCGGARQGDDSICVDCARCPGCQCSPTCASRNQLVGLGPNGPAVFTEV